MEGRWTTYREETEGPINGSIGGLLGTRLAEDRDRVVIPDDLYGLVIDDSWEQWLRGAAAAHATPAVTLELTRIADVLADGGRVTFERTTHRG